MARIDIQMNFTANKANLNEISTLLKQIQNEASKASLSGTLTSDLSKASVEAKKLENILNDAYNSKIGQLDLSRLNSNINSTYGSISQLKSSLDSIGRGDLFNRLQSSVLGTNMQLKESNKFLDEMAHTMSNTVKWGVTSSIFNQMSNSIQRAYEYAKQLDTSLNDIRIVTGYSAEQMESFAKSANRAAASLGASTRDYTEASLIYYQQGLSDEEVRARTDTTLKAANVTGQTGDEVSEQLTAIWNGYKVTADETELYIDKVAKVAAATAADLNELSTGMSKVASAAASAGVDIDQLNATLATVISVTREAPETIGTAFRSIYARLGDLALDGEDEFGVSLGTVSGQLEELGIQILDEQGQMRDMGDIVEDVAAKWQTWSQAQRQAAAVAMAGKQQYSRLIALFDNWDMYTDALLESQNAMGTLNEQQEIYMDSVEAHLQKLSTEAERTYDILFDTDAVNSMADALTGLLSIFNSFLGGYGGGLQSIGTLGSIAANVFNKQIAGGLSQIITNRDKMKKNLSDNEAIVAWSETDISNRSSSAYQEEAYKKERDMSQQLLGLAKNLSNEEYNRLNALKQEIALDAQLAASLKEQRDVLTTYKEITQELKNQKVFVKEQQTLYNNMKKTFEELQKTNFFSNGLDDNNLNSIVEYQSYLEDIIDISSGRDEIATQQQKIALQQALNTLNKEDYLTEDQARKVLEVQNQILQSQIQKEQELTNQAKLQQQLENGALEATEQRILKNTGDFNNSLNFDQRTVAISNVIQGLTTVSTLISGIVGIIKTSKDEDLEFWDKFSQILTVIASGTFMLIMNFGEVVTLLPSLITLFTGLSTSEFIAAQGATTLGAAIWSALAPIMPIILAVVAIIGTITTVAIVATNAYNEQAEAAKNAAKEAQDLQENYDNLKQSVENLHSEISDYTESLNALKELTKGTEEYSDALENANQKAKDLIETYDLYNEATVENGILTLDKETLDELEKQQQERVDNAEIASYLAQMNADTQQMKSKGLDLRRSWGYVTETYMGDRAGEPIEGSERAQSGGDSKTWDGNLISQESLDTVANGLRELGENLYTFNDEELKNAILNIDGLSDAAKAHIDAIVREKEALFDYIDSTNEAAEAADYFSNQILQNVVEDKYGQEYKDIAGDNDRIYNSLISAAAARSEEAQKVIEDSIANYSNEIDEIESNSDLRKFLENQELGENSEFLNWNWSGDDDRVLALKYAELVKGANPDDLSYSEDKLGHGTVTNSAGEVIVDNVEDTVMRRGLARQAIISKISEEQSGQLNLDEFNNAVQQLLNTTFGDEFGIDFFSAITDAISNKTEKLDFSSLFGELDPSELERLLNISEDPEKLKQALGLTDEQIQALGWDTAESFRTSFENALSQYDANAYIKNTREKINQQQGILGVLSSGSEEDLDKDQISYLKELEDEYSELANIRDKTSHEYLSLLREIKEQEETNVMDALEWEEEKQQEKVNTLMNELDSMLEDPEMDINSEEVKAKTEEVEEALQELTNTRYEIKLQIDADLASDVEDAFGIADELSGLSDIVSDDLTYTFEEAQDLIERGYGEMFTNAQETAENTIQVNKDVLNSFIDDKQAEIEADRTAKIDQLENQKTLLQAQRAALVNKLAALREAASAETAVDAATAMEKVYNANAEYEAATNALNAQLRDEATGATETQNINAELFNALGGMYETDTANEQAAEKAATDNQQQNIQARINNVHALHSAYSNLARQIAESESGRVVPVGGETAGSGGTLGNTNTSTEITAQEQTANEITLEQLKQQTEDLFNNSRDQYNATIDALINSTQSQIEGIDAQIGAADAGIAALKSAGTSLDKVQRDAKAGGSDGGSNKEKEPDQIDYVEGDIDRYHDVNIELEQISTTLDRLQKQQDKLFGQNLIDNLDKQLQSLNDQIDTTNEKIAIARGELSELRGELAQKGVSFNADGTIANYASAYQSQLNYVNSLIAQYNSMSAEAQEGFKEVVEQAQEDFDTFVDNIDRYDELISSEIPGLEDDIQDAIDKQIEIQIEKFNMEIEIRLDLAEAERDWNEFKRKVIDGIKDDDILGNAQARLQDFYSYYKKDGTGIIQANTEHVNALVDQLKQIESTGTSTWYGDNQAQALEDLKTYTDQLMSDLTDVEDLVEEIKDSYLDMMDEAADKFSDQINLYEQVKDIIDHDMNVIELVYGEDSYKDLEEYYQKQEDNYNAMIDFQRQQKDFWYNQMKAIEEAGGKNSEAWLQAKENWMDAVSEWNSSIEDAIENLQDKYLNAINAIFDELNDKVTGGLGLDYVSEEWELINANADQYLDTINSLYGIQDLENKYLDAIDNTDSISAQRQLNDLMNEELAALREKDKLTQYDIDRANMKYEIALKQIALEEAQQNKSTMRLRRDSQGNYTYQYVSDDDQIGQLEDELSQLKNELYNFDLEHYRDNLDQVYSIWEEFQQKMAEAAMINDPEERQQRELLLREQYGELINGLVEQNETIRLNLNESAFTELADLYNIDYANFQQLSDQERDIMLSQMIPQWESGVQHMADVFAGEGGFVPTVQEAMDKLDDTTNEYQNDLNELQNTADQDFGSIKNGIDDTISKTQELITNNSDLISKYQEELNAIGAVISQLQALVSQYELAKNAAIAATEAAYGYWRAQQRQAANAAGNSVSGGGSSSSSGSGSGSSSSSSKGSSGSSSGGGASVGNKITYTGKYYYDSYGTSPAGSRYAGVSDGVVIDIVNNNPYGIHIKSSDGRYPDLGWIKRSQVTRWNTGGYTGDWGNDSGKLAILDRKELVLNKDDTSNMLNMVEITRDLMNSMNSSMMNRISNSLSGIKDNTSNQSLNSEQLEQNVHIEATFPGVRDAKEIEEALNNLTNIAAQRIHRKK